MISFFFQHFKFFGGESEGGGFEVKCVTLFCFFGMLDTFFGVISVNPLSERGERHTCSQYSTEVPTVLKIISPVSSKTSPTLSGKTNSSPTVN